MKDVEIYPSSWYYNACVHGFLEVIAWGLGDRGKDIVEEQFLQNDGSVLIPRELMEAIFSTEDIPAPSGYELREVPDEVNTLKRIAWWWVKISNKVEDDNPEVILESTRRSMFGSNKTFYPNLLPHNQKISTKEFLNDWFSFITEGEVNCSFCNMPCQHAENQAEKMYFFNNCISKHLGSTLNKIPNLYWDTQPNIIMCPLCRSYMLFFHIIQEKNIYVNTELIFLNWHLNNFVEQKYKKEKSYQQTFLEALRYDTQMRKTLGVWGLQNLELIIMEWGNITVQPITERLASLLLIPKVGNLLNLLSNSLVWNLFIQERFDHLLILAYKNLRFYLSGKNKNKDPEISLKGKNAFFSKNLVELFYTVKQNYFKGGESMDTIKFGKIQWAAENAPLELTNNADKAIVFRLLELTRLNKKTEVYHLLLRNYIANDKEFPDSLETLFTLNDKQLFQTGIYAYIAGLKANKTNFSENKEES